MKHQVGDITYNAEPDLSVFYSEGQCWLVYETAINRNYVEVINGKRGRCTGAIMYNQVVCTSFRKREVKKHDL